MTERAALVTGASSGIGLAIAELLVEEGFRLTLTARREQKLFEATRELLDAGHEVEVVAADLGSEEQIKGVVDRHRERFGRLDVLVNNAGVGFSSPIAEISTKHLDLQLELNLRAVVLFHRECVGMLRAAGAGSGGLIVNTSSMTGKCPQPELSVYSATKAAIIAWTQSMRAELIADGIKSTVLCPAYVATPMSEFIEGEIPRSEMLKTSDVVAGVRMLLQLSPNCDVPEIPFQRAGGEI